MDKTKYNLPYTITLREPIVGIKSEPVTSITIMRKPKVKDLEGLSKDLSEVDVAAKMLSRVTGEISAVISEMDPFDFQEANKVMSHFLPKSQETGTN